MNFIPDELGGSRQIRIVAIIDNVARESLLLPTYQCLQGQAFEPELFPVIGGYPGIRSQRGAAILARFLRKNT